MRCLALAAALTCSLHAQSTAAASPDYFELRIRPVLATNCYSCHTDSALGGLRLDSRESMIKGGSRGPSLIPGDPEKSILIQAVRQTDPKLKMPMGSKLKGSEVEDLVAWVKAGAVWPKSSAPITTASGKYIIPPERKAFWSLLPLKDPQPPAVKDAKWLKAPIDKFILARLEKDGMKPVRPANKRDLLRRATLDLTGLPPTPEEIAVFDKDTSPDAFAKVVDRLLASPHYGERWGREWLDVARFGEDDYRSLNPFPRGYFPYANAYLYRDWVIQAFNDDLPYDQFVKAQLAGDVLPEKVRYKYLAATGFLGLGPWYFDNGAVEVTRADERHDRVDVVTRGFLGLTVACARCHDHKYDPIPQTDYYSLAGVFKNTTYHEYPLAPKAVVEEHLKIEAQVEKKEKVLEEMQTALSNSLSESLAFQTANYLEGVYEVTGQKKDKDAVVEARKLDYELLDRWIAYVGKTTDKYHEKEAFQSLMKKAVPVVAAEAGGRGGRGGGAKDRVSPEVKKAAEEFQANVVKVLLARKELDDENQVITAKSLEGTTKKKRANKPNEFITNDDFCPGCGLRLKNMTEQESNFWTEIFLRELRDSDDPTVDAANGAKAPKPGVLLFRGWGLESRVGPEAQARMASIKADIEAAKKKLDPTYPYIHGVEDVEKPVDLEVALRGNPNTLGDKVPRHFLSVLSKDDPQPFKQGSGRLELAEDILKQPIAMRVIVNRIWKGHFGTGIVDTPSNFGIGGERPTNPDLLDYLATQFVKDGMSIKKLHRAIMLSATYQLSADNDEANFAKDSGDRLYWRVERKRMDAEQIRDAVLMVAGNLDNSLGGPSQDLSPTFTRRTVYGKVSRYKLDEYLQLFDFPSPNISAEKRFTTTVPLQRLFLMNSDFMQLESEELAKRVAAEPDNRARIRKVYVLAYGRDPNEEEIKLGLEYLHAEPMREYEEEKNKPTETGSGRGGTAPFTGAAKPEPTEGGAGPEAAAAVPEMGMGMFGGMAGRGGRGGATPEVKYEPTAWGRYIKVLLSSSEFVFIN
jgi:mono/diheme cytochrome c family protein